MPYPTLDSLPDGISGKVPLIVLTNNMMEMKKKVLLSHGQQLRSNILRKVRSG